MHPKATLLTVVSLLWCVAASAQRPMICGPDARMELACVDACIICDIDGFQGRNDTQGQGDKPPSFCTSINHNIQWIGFLANSPTLTLELAVSNCAGGNRPDGGLEAGVFEVEGCRIDEAAAVSNCDSDIANNTTQEFRMTALVPGDYYYFIIDGNNGDVCDYTVTVTEGTTRVPDVPSSGGLNGPTRVCENEPFAYRTSAVSGAPYRDWTLNGDTLGLETDLEQTLTFDTAGVYELCVTASNICNRGPQECLTIRVGDFAPTRVELTTCDNAPVEIAGQPRSTSGEWTVVLDNSVGCDSTVTYALEVFATATTALDTTVCAGFAVDFAGQTLTAVGTYTDQLQTARGCDSTVTLTLTLESCGYRAGATATAVSCSGDADGLLELYALGPAPPYVAEVEAPDGTARTIPIPADSTVVALRDLAPGRYTVRFTDDYGVVQTYTPTVGEPTALRVTTSVSEARPGYAVSCPQARDGEATALATGGTAPYRYTWANGAPEATVRDLAAGDYAVTAFDARGCTATATARLTAPPEIPLTQLTRSTCANEPVLIGGVLRSQPGEYRETLTSRYGCDSVVATTLEVLATAETLIDSTICQGWTVDFGRDALTSAGTYVQNLTTRTGCDSTVTLRLSVNDCSYRLAVEALPVRCFGEENGGLVVTVNGPAGSYAAEWYGGGDAGFGGSLSLPGDGSETLISDLVAGDYTVEVTDVYGVTQTMSAEIEEPTELTAEALATTVGQHNISCAGAADGEIELALAGGTAPYTVAWAQGQNSSRRTDLAPGTYYAEVLDDRGCRVTTETTLTEPEPLTLRALPEARGCTDEEPGGVYLDDFGGGHGDYRVSVDGGFAARAESYYRLDTGLHTLVLEDAEGCTLTRRVLVEATPVPTVALAPQVFVQRGDSARLEANAQGDIVRLAWSGPGAPGCTECSAITVRPDTSASYTVTVTNRDGCRATAEVIVYVRVQRDVYAPTAISPNGDGRNDGFTLFARDPASRIEELRVFDRWGNQVFVAVDLPVGEERLGWRGDHRGEPVRPGVFVWWATVRDGDDVVTQVQGDVTVVR